MAGLFARVVGVAKILTSIAPSLLEYMACRTGLLMPGSWTIQENRKNFHEFGTFFKAQNPSIALGGVSEFKTMEL